MKRIVQFLLISLMAVNLSYAVILGYDDTPGKKYRLKTTIEQDIYVDAYLYASREGMFKTTLALADYSNSYAMYNGEYYYFSRDSDSSEALKLESYYETEFFRNRLGDMIVPSQYYMPAIRGVPAFPDYNLEIGDSWTATGEEYHEPIMSGFNPLRFNMNVRYRLLDIFSNEGRALATISADYHVTHFPPGDPYILSFTGYSHTTFYWDIESGMRDHSEEEFTFMATLYSGESILYNGWSETEVEELFDLTNSHYELLHTLLTENVSDNSSISVERIDDGILLKMGNILFEFDEATLREKAEETLNQVAETLREYPELDIEIYGYTDNIGTEEYNLELSEARALAVTEYLIGRGIEADRISYAGLGSADPVEDNSTPEGRSMNRRVEIKIITTE